MSLIQLLRILWARRIILLVTTVSCLFGAVLIAKMFAPRFQAESRVMLDLVKPDPVTGEVIASGFARAYVKTQTELIKDYRIAGAVVDQLGWTSSLPLSQEFAARPASDTRDFRRWLAQRIIDNTDAGLVDNSNILEIRFTSTSPTTAAKVADTIRQAYMDQALALRRDDAANNAIWFRQQASRIRSELTAAEKRKSDFERANGILLQDNNVDTDSARLAALAGSAPAQAAGAVTLGGGPVPSPQLEQANAAVASAEKVLGPNNPELLALKRQRDAIAASVAAANRAAPRVAGPSGPSLSSLYSAQQAKVLAQRGKVSEAQQLATDVTVLRDQYAKTSARAAELQTQGESTETGLTFLGNAVAPQSPSFPKWPLIIFGSIALGLVLGILLSIVIELVARRVRGIEDLRVPDVPVLGVMTRTTKRRRGLLARILPARAPAMQGG